VSVGVGEIGCCREVLEEEWQGRLLEGVGGMGGPPPWEVPIGGVVESATWLDVHRVRGRHDHHHGRREDRGLHGPILGIDRRTWW
jgi:hypothetical protein